MASAMESCEKYDVFLSFRGEDTRYNFTSHLHKSLFDHNVKVFIDYNIRRGQEITPALMRVIEGAKMSIVVFSKNYAESTFCLDELLKIMESRDSKGQIVLPIFYKVEPAEEIYQEAFESHEKETISQEMNVEAWKSAFRQALGLAGEPIDDKSNEAERIDKITTEVLLTLKELNNSLSKGEELIGTSLVGETVENNFKKIWKCLMNDKISRVGIYGMGGVGKTTIATHINNQLLQVANSFTHIYWVTVSKDSSIYNLQSGIAKKINLDLSKQDDEMRRAAMIQKELANKKFLLILDDVWEAYELTKDVGLPPLVGGQKLLLTSRKRRVCERMECLPIEVKPLGEHEALNLFVKESNYQLTDSRECKDIMHSIVKECDGLPLAVVVVARRTRAVMDIREWRNTLRELQKPCEGENPEMEEKVYKVLKFSFDRLPNDMYRRCFLYCSLFPEDHEFKEDHLYEYWIGEGLIDGLDSRQEELDKSSCILTELIHASLLENISGKTVKMHDVIRDMARMNVKVGLRFEDPFQSVQVLKTFRSFSDSAPYCSKLKTLVFQGGYKKELSSCFPANMHRLNVLHMTRMKKLKSIPDSITNLRNLRVLIINDCDLLKCIPSLIGLENLRVLDLSKNGSLGGSFPKGVLKKLCHLQTLNLRYTRVEAEPKELTNLKKLEILMVHFRHFHKFNSYVKSGHWQRLVDYQIYYGRCDDTNLRRSISLKEIMDVEEWSEESGIFLPDNIEYLCLENWESPMFNVLKNKTFAHLQTITIRWYKSKYLFTVELAQQLLRNVEELIIIDCEELDEIIGREDENYTNYPTIVLPNLKVLKLFTVPKLRSIYRQAMVCPSLELIHFEECDKLERLPFSMEKEGDNQSPTIKLVGWNEPISRRWWNSLRWDDPNAKSMYDPNLIEGVLDLVWHEGESEVDIGNESY